MEALIKSIIDIYNSFPDWLKISIISYVLPSIAINFGLDGIKTKFKKLTGKKINPWIIIIAPIVLGFGYAYFKSPNDWWYNNLANGFVIFMLSFLADLIYDKYFNKYKAKEGNVETK